MGWQWVPASERLDPATKSGITAACEALIADRLLPRFLPEISPTPFNYPVGFHGKWHGKCYRFITRYRSGFADTLAEEFDAPFSRIEFVGKDRFDLAFFRHTGQWWPIYQGMTLTQALESIATDEMLQPHV